MTPHETNGQTAHTRRSEPSLTARVVRGAAWVFAGKIVGRLLDLVKLVILARLLSPEDFGLFGIVMLALATLETFSQTGFGEALIQRQGDIRPYLDTAWTIHVIRGFVLGALLFATAPLVGAFFAEPRAVPLLRVMSVAPVLGGLANIGMIYFQKELQFNKQVAYNLSVALVSATVGILLAFHLRSVWALVWASLAGSVVKVVLSYVMHPWRPHIHWDASQAAALFRYGRWVLSASVVVFLATQLDHAFLGKMLGAAALGLYQLASRIGNLPATEISHVTNAVMMPTYAKVQDDKARLGRAFLSVLELVVSLALPLTVFMVLAAHDIVLGLLGPKWEAAVVPLQIIAGAGFLRALAATGGPVFLGTGSPHIDFWMNLTRAAVIAASAYPLTRAFGVAGTASCVALALATTLPIWARAWRIAGVTWRDILDRSSPGLFLSALAAVGLSLARLVATGSVTTHLCLDVVVCTALCVAGAWAMGRFTSRGPLAQTSRAVAAFRPASPDVPAA